MNTQIIEEHHHFLRTQTLQIMRLVTDLYEELDVLSHEVNELKKFMAQKRHRSAAVPYTVNRGRDHD